MATNNELRVILSEPHVRRSVTRALLRVFLAIENENRELWEDLWCPAFSEISDIVAEPENFAEFCKSLPNSSESLDDEQEGEKLDVLAQCFQKTDISSVMDFYGISKSAFFHELAPETRKTFTKIVDERVDACTDYVKQMPVEILANCLSSGSGALVVERLLAQCFQEIESFKPISVAIFASGFPSGSGASDVVDRALDVVDRCALAYSLTLPSDILDIYCMDTVTD